MSQTEHLPIGLFFVADSSCKSPKRDYVYPQNGRVPSLLGRNLRDAARSGCMHDNISTFILSVDSLERAQPEQYWVIRLFVHRAARRKARETY